MQRKAVVVASGGIDISLVCGSHNGDRCVDFVSHMLPVLYLSYCVVLTTMSWVISDGEGDKPGTKYMLVARLVLKSGQAHLI